MPRNISLRYRAGVVKDRTARAAQGYFTASNRIRFVHGQPQKLGGWAPYARGQISPPPRRIRTWIDNSNLAVMAMGTPHGLFSLINDVIREITPYVIQGTLTNAVTVAPITGGEVMITIAHDNHGLTAGTTIQLSGATDAVGGVDLNRIWTIETVVDENSYTLDTTDVTATAAVMDGGGEITWGTRLENGAVSSIYGDGYGTGSYGLVPWNRPTGDFRIVPLRTWSIDGWGEDIIANPHDGPIFYWSPRTSAPAQQLSEAPTSCTYAFVTAERHLVALGGAGDRLLVQWSDQDNRNVWSPSEQNTAGSRRLEGGNHLVAGLRIRNGNLLFTDASVWLMAFIGALDVFGFHEQAEDRSVGLISPGAVVEASDITYWMGIGDFYMYDGVVRSIPRSNNIRHDVYQNLDAQQSYKITAVPIAEYSEIFWFYPTTDSGGENNRYIKYNWKERCWDEGALNRVAGIDADVIPNPIMVDEDGNFWLHETGHNAGNSPMGESITMAPFELDEGTIHTQLRKVYHDFDDMDGSLICEAITRAAPGAPETTVTVGEVTSDAYEHSIRAAGRQIALRYRGAGLSNQGWRLGRPMIMIERGGTR